MFFFHFSLTFPSFSYSPIPPILTFFLISLSLTFRSEGRTKQIIEKLYSMAGLKEIDPPLPAKKRHSSFQRKNKFTVKFLSHFIVVFKLGYLICIVF